MRFHSFKREAHRERVRVGRVLGREHIACIYMDDKTSSAGACTRLSPARGVLSVCFTLQSIVLKICQLMLFFFYKEMKLLLLLLISSVFNKTDTNEKRSNEKIFPAQLQIELPSDSGANLIKYEMSN